MSSFKPPETRHLLKDLAVYAVHRELRPLYRPKETLRAPRRAWDFEPRAGLENLAQAVMLRLLTPRGELAALGHPEYGSRVHELIGRENTSTQRNLLKLFILEALQNEPRVAKVVELKVGPSPGAAQHGGRAAARAARAVRSGGHHRPLRHRTRALTGLKGAPCPPSAASPTPRSPRACSTGCSAASAPRPIPTRPPVPRASPMPMRWSVRRWSASPPSGAPATAPACASSPTPTGAWPPTSAAWNGSPAASARTKARPSRCTTCRSNARSASTTSTPARWCAR